MFLDFSRQRVTLKTLDLLFDLAEAADLKGKVGFLSLPVVSSFWIRMCESVASVVNACIPARRFFLEANFPRPLSFMFRRSHYSRLPPWPRVRTSTPRRTAR